MRDSMQEAARGQRMPADPRLDEIEVRLSRVERAAARWRGAALGLGVALLATLAATGGGLRARAVAGAADAAAAKAAPANATFDHVNTRGLTVLDARDRPVVNLDSREEGGLIYLETADASAAVTITTGKNSAALRLQRGAVDQVSLTTGEDRPRLRLNDARNQEVFHAPTKEQ